MGLERERIVISLKLPALLFQMSVPIIYWGEAVLTGTYLINRLSTYVLNGISLVQHMLAPFIFYHVNPPWVTKCVFISYSSNKRGYKCFHPQIIVSIEPGGYSSLSSIKTTATRCLAAKERTPLNQENTIVNDEREKCTETSASEAVNKNAYAVSLVLVRTRRSRKV
ncbi:hypothetical protein CR513_48909, partial [Mucuna pruriens]